jgi:DNA ligase 1
LLLGIEENNRIKPAGIMEFVTPAARKQFYNQYQDLIVEENKKFIYWTPRLNAELSSEAIRRMVCSAYLFFVEYIS